jgi:hypothetical protein
VNCNRLISLTLLALMILTNVVLAEAGSKSFVRLRFGNNISVNWPKDWENRDGRTNELINTSTASTLSLAGIDNNWHENRILINSFCRSSSSVLPL